MAELLFENLEEIKSNGFLTVELAQELKKQNYIIGNEIEVCDIDFEKDGEFFLKLIFGTQLKYNLEEDDLNDDLIEMEMSEELVPFLLDFNRFTPIIKFNERYFLAYVYRLFVKDELIFGRDFLITRSKFLRINLKKYCDIFNSLNERQKLNTAQLKLKLANDKRFNLKSSDLKPIGKAIKVDISENEILLDILNRVMPVNSAEGEDD